MSEDHHRQLLTQAIDANDKAESVGILARILADKGGRDYILRANRQDAESCIEILDYVSRGLHLVPLCLS